LWDRKILDVLFRLAEVFQYSGGRKRLRFTETRVITCINFSPASSQHSLWFQCAAAHMGGSAVVVQADNLPIEELAVLSDVLVICGSGSGNDTEIVNRCKDSAGNTPMIHAELCVDLAHVYTILQQQRRLASRRKRITVTLLGDVSNSLILLRTLAMFSTEVRIIVMAPYIPLSWRLNPPGHFEEADSLASVLPQTDVLYIMRPLYEGIPTPFVLTEEVMTLAKLDMIVLFPDADADMKRRMFGELGNDKRLETKQLLEDAMAVRMAILYSLFANCSGDHE
jgi:aspartate carbamoyltransferase catalytic subunit